MSDSLRDCLVAKLTPVRRIDPPWKHASIWLGFVAAAAIVLAAFADLSLVVHHLMLVPDMWMAELGAVMTAGAAALATFQLCRPDSTPRWAALPFPPLALWIGASWGGTASVRPIVSLTEATLMEATHYISWVIFFSVPLTVTIFWLIRRGYTLFPKLTGAIAGLAVASAAAALMVLCYPFEASLTDLVVHGLVVLLVVAVNRTLGGRLFGQLRAPLD